MGCGRTSYLGVNLVKVPESLLFDKLINFSEMALQEFMLWKFHVGRMFYLCHKVKRKRKKGKSEHRFQPKTLHLNLSHPLGISPQTSYKTNSIRNRSCIFGVSVRPINNVFNFNDWWILDGEKTWKYYLTCTGIRAI